MTITPEMLDLIVTAVSTYADSGEHAEHFWKLTPARIITPSDTSPTAVFDGDGALGTSSTPVPLISLIGYCPAGARVMVMFVPPAGNYVVAPLTPFEASARMSTDQNLDISSITLQEVSQLSVIGEANFTYQLNGELFYQSDTSADIKFAFVFDSSVVSSMSWAPAGFLPGGINFESWFGATYRQASGTANAVAGLGLGAGNTVGTPIRGTINMGGTRGPITLWAAQNSAHASQTVLLADSWIEIKRMT